MAGTTRKPAFETILYNDAAIAVGAGNWVDGAVVSPLDGYLVAVAVAGAGVEDGEIRDSMGSPVQHIPGTDLAIDTNALMQLAAPGPGMFASSPFVLINQPTKLNVRYDIQYPNGNSYGRITWRKSLFTPPELSHSCSFDRCAIS